MKKYLKWFLWFVVITAAMSVLYVTYIIYREKPVENVQYGVSFNTMYAKELGLDWREVYVKTLSELGVKHFRLAAHWPMVSPKEEEWNFKELDEQVSLAKEYHADVVLAIGRRLPRWPECHVPAWAKSKSWEDQKELLREYIRVVVNRYKDDPTVVYWQIENEPFLTIYAKEQCDDLDVAFLDEEIALVREIDPTRPVLVTDSGNLGTWQGAYRRGDVFGTSVYVYLWNDKTGAIETILPPQTYILKQKLMGLFFGKKESMLIELSVEPWLDRPIADVDVKLQFERMNIDRFEEVLKYAKETGFEKQYLWGVEWWYWLKKTKGRPEFWEKAIQVYK